MIEIDLLSDGSEFDYTQTIVIDGVTCIARLLYNVRRDVWTLDLDLEDGTVLLRGQALVLYVDLLERCFVQGRPPGRLVAITYQRDTSTPGQKEIGNDARCRLNYVEVADLEDA